MKDRMISIFKAIRYKPFPCMESELEVGHQFTDYAIAHIVDEIVASGVIFPVCQPGTPLYAILFDNVKGELVICEGHLEAIKQDKSGVHYHILDSDTPKYANLDIWLDAYQFNRFVFYGDNAKNRAEDFLANTYIKKN